jgi:hypothetical protein
MAREEGGEGLTAGKSTSLRGSRRRGSASLDLHIEVVPVGFYGDGVLDGIQEFKARSKAWCSISEVPCKRARERLEVRARLGYAEHGGRMTHTRRPGKRRCYQEVQGIEACLVARPASLRCTGVLEISR